MTIPLEDIIVLVANLHRDQKDKAGKPYILHPLHVMLKMDTESEQRVAILHDVVEDTDIALYYLNTLCELTIEEYKALNLLTKKKKQSYMDYIRGIKSSPSATKVKLVDLEHNMDISRLPEQMNQQEQNRLEKYEKARSYLKGDVE